MVGFFKQWATNASEYKRLQQELTVIFARSGVNFMHLHPEITKYLVRVARVEGAPGAFAKLNAMLELATATNPGITQEQSQQQLIRNLKAINEQAK